MSDLVLCIRSADCLPILLHDSDGRGVGALHAGWRGLLDGIVDKGVSELCRLTGCPPRRILATIGPAIRMSCYEVGAEIRQTFKDRYGSEAGIYFRSLGSSLKASLPGLAVWRLKNAGVTTAHIHARVACTACDSRRYYSFRAREDSGRMVSFIYKGSMD